ncbi:MAG: hypothetical protein HY895_02360 [Deltaproteobacteria bacterium]|nr:hypothetical protein [Deltaproteobacteria bacterium]
MRRVKADAGADVRRLHLKPVFQKAQHGLSGVAADDTHAKAPGPQHPDHALRKGTGQPPASCRGGKKPVQVKQNGGDVKRPLHHLAQALEKVLSSQIPQSLSIHLRTVNPALTS